MDKFLCMGIHTCFLWKTQRLGQNHLLDGSMPLDSFLILLDWNICSLFIANIFNVSISEPWKPELSTLLFPPKQFPFQDTDHLLSFTNLSWKPTIVSGISYLTLILCCKKNYLEPNLGKHNTYTKSRRLTMWRRSTNFWSPRQLFVSNHESKSCINKITGM